MKIKFNASSQLELNQFFKIGFEKDVEEDYWFYLVIFGVEFNLRIFKKDSGWMPYYYSDDPYADMTEEEWAKTF
jgi:hypothetical protein